MRTDERTALARARALASTGKRAMLAVAGPPGAGKSTLAQRIVADLGDIAIHLPMDGFHLADVELERLGRRGRKGAIDTFDSAGFFSLLERIRSHVDTVYAPTFERTIEDPIAGAIAIPPTGGLVVVEGNYLLVDREPWSRIPALCDETWYADMDEPNRIGGLVRRHMCFGMDRWAAENWAREVDQRNAELVETSRDRADLVVSVDVGVPA